MNYQSLRRGEKGIDNKEMLTPFHNLTTIPLSIYTHPVLNFVSYHYSSSYVEGIQFEDT